MIPGRYSPKPRQPFLCTCIYHHSSMTPTTLKPSLKPNFTVKSVLSSHPHLNLLLGLSSDACLTVPLNVVPYFFSSLHYDLLSWHDYRILQLQIFHKSLYIFYINLLLYSKYFIEFRSFLLKIFYLKQWFYWRLFIKNF